MFTNNIAFCAQHHLVDKGLHKTTSLTTFSWRSWQLREIHSDRACHADLVIWCPPSLYPSPEAIKVLRPSIQWEVCSRSGKFARHLLWTWTRPVFRPHENHAFVWRNMKEHTEDARRWLFQRLARSPRWFRLQPPQKSLVVGLLTTGTLIQIVVPQFVSVQLVCNSNNVGFCWWYIYS